MMMKKTTSALAVAALLGTSAASAVTFQVNDETSLSISTGVFWAYVESTDKNGAQTTSWSDNGSHLVFDAEHQASDGLTTFLTIDLDEFGTPKSEGQPSLNDTDETDDIEVDEMSLGVAGDFGKITVGSDGDPYGAVDGLKDIDAWAGVYGLTGSDDNMVKYDSVDLNGLSYTIAANVFNDESSKSGTTVQANVAYDLGAAQIVGAYNNRGGQAIDDPFYGFGISTSLGGVGVAATYEVDTLDSKEADMVSLTGTYGMDNLDFYGVVQSLSFDDIAAAKAGIGTTITQTDDSFTQYLAGFRYHLSDHLSMGAELNRTGYENDEGDATALFVDAYF